MDGWEKSADIRISRLSHKLKKIGYDTAKYEHFAVNLSWLQTISAELLNLNWNDC